MSALDDQIVEALMNKNQDRLTELQSHVDVNSTYAVPGEPDRPLLVWAAAFGFRELVEALLSRDPDVSAFDAKGRTALHHATMNSTRRSLSHGERNTSLEIVEKLLQCQSIHDFVNARDRDKSTPLLLALDHAHTNLLCCTSVEVDSCAVQTVKVVKILQQHGADFKAEDGFGATPLLLCDKIGARFVALKRPMSEVKSLLLPFSKPKDVALPMLVLAATLGCWQVVELLLEDGGGEEDVSASTCDASGLTALHHAAMNSHLEVVQILLGSEAIDVNVRNSDGSTPLLLALERAESELDGLTVFDPEDHLPLSPFKEGVVEELQEHGASVDVQDQSGKTPLVLYDKIGATFLALGVPLSELKKLLSLPVKARLKKIQKESSKLSKGDSPNATESEVLFQAAIAGVPLILHRLLQKQVSINCKNEFERTPLHCAVILQNTDVVEIFLQMKDVDTFAKDKDGKIALYYAREAMHQDIQKLFDAAENRLYRDRQVSVDATNAILVGAALIASVTFSGWLQPPSGYSTSVRVFYVFNSLSFFFAIATVLIGAGAVLPVRESNMQQSYIGDEVRILQRALGFSANFLMFSVVCVLGAFAAAGFAALPPNASWDMYMVSTVCVGGSANLGCLAWFLVRLYRLAPNRLKMFVNSCIDHAKGCCGF